MGNGISLQGDRGRNGPRCTLDGFPQQAKER
jgi:hypothetical protein